MELENAFINTDDFEKKAKFLEKVSLGKFVLSKVIKMIKNMLPKL